MCLSAICIAKSIDTLKYKESGGFHVNNFGSTACDSFWFQIRRDQSWMSGFSLLVNSLLHLIQSIHSSKLQRQHTGRGSREILHNRSSEEGKKKDWTTEKSQNIKNPLWLTIVLKPSKQLVSFPPLQSVLSLQSHCVRVMRPSILVRFFNKTFHLNTV